MKEEQQRDTPGLILTADMLHTSLLYQNVSTNYGNRTSFFEGYISSET